MWREYQELVQALLTDDDYQVIAGNKFRKKSGWRKLARFFNISIEKIDQVITRDEFERPVYATVTVRASAPNGRSVTATHEAHVLEKCCADREAPGDCRLREVYEDSGKPTGHVHCSSECTGWRHWSHPGDLVATSETRATNRAISDIIGAGEVSAEEMSLDKNEAGETAAGQTRGTRTVQPPQPRTSQRRVFGEANTEAIMKRATEWWGNQSYAKLNEAFVAIGLSGMPDSIAKLDASYLQPFQEQMLKMKPTEALRDDLYVHSQVKAKTVESAPTEEALPQEEETPA
jgi:hypothetical protein